MINYIGGGLARTAQRVDRALKTRSIANLSDRHVEVCAAYLKGRDELRKAYQREAALRIQLGNIVMTAGAVKVPNGTTRKMARIATEALELRAPA